MYNINRQLISGKRKRGAWPTSLAFAVSRAFIYMKSKQQRKCTISRQLCGRSEPPSSKPKHGSTFMHGSLRSTFRYWTATSRIIIMPIFCAQLKENETPTKRKKVHCCFFLAGPQPRYAMRSLPGPTTRYCFASPPLRLSPGSTSSHASPFPYAWLEAESRDARGGGTSDSDMTVLSLSFYPSQFFFVPGRKSESTPFASVRCTKMWLSFSIPWDQVARMRRKRELSVCCLAISLLVVILPLWNLALA